MKYMQNSIISQFNCLSRIEVKKNKRQPQKTYVKIANILRKINPKNWFADFSTISITLEEFTPKKFKQKEK